LRRHPNPFIAVALCAISFACSTTPSSKKGNNASKQAATFGPVTTNNGGGSAATGGNSNVTGSTPASTQPASESPKSLGLWCAAAATTEIVKVGSHARQLANLCAEQNIPTKIFADLVAKAYTGTGKPNITNLGGLEFKNGQVSWAYGSAIKLPLDAKSHFEKAAPKQGDRVVQEQLLVADGAQNVSVSSTPIAVSQDKGWVRGWDMSQDWTKTIFILSVRTTYDYQVNHYDLQNGLYMYVQSFERGTSTVRNNELLSALFELNGSAYLAVIGDVTVDDQGFPSQAANGLLTTVERSLMQVYEQSKLSR